MAGNAGATIGLILFFLMILGAIGGGGYFLYTKKKEADDAAAAEKTTSAETKPNSAAASTTPAPAPPETKPAEVPAAVAVTPPPAPAPVSVAAPVSVPAPVELFDYSICETAWPTFKKTFARPVRLSEATYGRPSTNIPGCNHAVASANAVCAGKSYLDKIKALFEGKTEIAGNNKKFNDLVAGDPCPNIFKVIRLRGQF